MTLVSRWNIAVCLGLLGLPSLPGCTMGEDYGGSISSTDQPLQSSSSDECPSDEVREKFMYTVCNNVDPNSNDPDFVAVIGADPRAWWSYGKIVSRLDLTENNELHHFHYSDDQSHLNIGGLASGKMFVVNVEYPYWPRLTATSDLISDSGYVGPHSLVPQGDGTSLVTMLGADTESGGPAGIIRIDQTTGQFLDYYGPGPNRDPADEKPQYVYDFVPNEEANRAISTNWGWLKNVYPVPLVPFATEVNVWDVEAEEVIQSVELDQPTFEVVWDETPGVRRGFIGGGTSMYLFEDDDGDGFYDFHKILDDLANVVDYRTTHDGDYLFVSDWVLNVVRAFDISDPLNPVLVSEVSIPHSGMIRVSPDDERIYVTNEVVSTYEAAYGINNNYGIWQFDFDEDTGALISVTGDESPWVDLMNVQKKNTRGPAGCHMIEWDPSVPLDPHHG